MRLPATLERLSRGQIWPRTLAAVAAVLLSPAVGYLLVGHQYTVIVMLIGSVAGLLVVGWPILGLYLMIGLIPFEATVLVTTSFTAAKLVGWITFGAWLARKIIRREAILLVRDRQEVLMVGLIMLSLLSTQWAYYPMIAWSKTISYVQLYLFYVIMVDLLKTPARWRRAIMVLTLAIVASTSWAVFQYYSGGMARAEGGAGNPNILATLLVIGIPVSLQLYWEAKGWHRWLWAAVGLIFFVGLGVSFSRSGYIAFVALLPILLAPRHRPKSYWQISAILILLLTLTFFLLPTDAIYDRARTIFTMEGNAPARLNLLQAAGYVILDHPLLGVGSANAHWVVPRYQSRITFRPDIFTYTWTVKSIHNSYVTMLAELGPMGILLFGAILFLCWRKIAQVTKQIELPGHDVGPPLIFGLKLALAGVLIRGLFGTIHGEKPLWFLLGWVSAVSLHLQGSNYETSFSEQSEERITTRGW